MKIPKKGIIFIITVLIGVSFFIAAYVKAQDDDTGQEATQPPPIATPSSSPPSIDWAQVQMPPHDQPETPDSSSRDDNPNDNANDGPNNNTSENEIEALPPILAPTTYTIQRGDTLNLIASRFGVTIANLAASNNISNPSLIYVGQVITIPGSETQTESQPTEPETAQPEGAVYTVKRGDSLSVIASRFGVSMESLAAANQITNPSLIRVGQVLTLATAVPTTPPPVSAETTEEPAPTVQPSSDDQTYVVQYGDSLHKIARRFGVSIQSLADINQITNPSLIYQGQTLNIGSASAASDPAPSAPPPVETPPDSIFIWPVESRNIVQYYRWGHLAIDLVLPTGTPINAVAAGIIEFAGWNYYGYGNLVVIDHGDGWRTVYAHNSEFKVKTGDTVAQGDVISLSGNTGYSTMPHLHLEMIQNKNALNPCSYLPGGC